jgi:hypothetical protein
MPGIESGHILWDRPYHPILVLRAPGFGRWGPGCTPSWVTKGGGVHNGLIGDEILSVGSYRDETEEWVIPRSNSFEVGGPSPSTKSGGAGSGKFAAGGNQVYPDFMGRNRRAAVPGQKCHTPF